MFAQAPLPLAASDLERLECAPATRRGALRLLHALGYAAIAELPLTSGRRADLVALGPNAEIWIVEIKSSVADFRADRKWQEYRLHCDRLLFAVSPEFPVPLLPADAGLMIVDAYGGTLLREGVEHPVGPARRKALLLRFGRAAAARLASVHDARLAEPAV